MVINLKTMPCSKKDKRKSKPPLFKTSLFLSTIQYLLLILKILQKIRLYHLFFFYKLIFFILNAVKRFYYISPRKKDLKAI